jgi:hypothetical protein
MVIATVGWRSIRRRATQRNTLEIFVELSTAVLATDAEHGMSEFRFSIVVATPPLAEAAILDAADALGAAGCLDASIRGHAEGMELLFDRQADSLQLAIQSAVAEVESAGFAVARVEMEREAIAS